MLRPFSSSSLASPHSHTGRDIESTRSRSFMVENRSLLDHRFPHFLSPSTSGDEISRVDTLLSWMTFPLVSLIPPARPFFFPCCFVGCLGVAFFSFSLCISSFPRRKRDWPEVTKLLPPFPHFPLLHILSSALSAGGAVRHPQEARGRTIRPWFRAIFLYFRFPR